MAKEQLLTLVDRSGKPSGKYATRSLCHLFAKSEDILEKRKHLAIQVLTFKDKKLILHLRDEAKLGGGRFDCPTTHVLKGETYESAARRCLKNEYSITKKIPLYFVSGFQYRENYNDGTCENEFCGVMWCDYKGIVTPNEKEMSFLRIVPFNEIIKNLKTKEKDRFTIWLRLALREFLKTRKGKAFTR